MLNHLFSKRSILVPIVMCLAVCVAKAEPFVLEIQRETMQRYTVLRQNFNRSDAEQNEYCNLLFVLAERARLRADKNFAIYVEELLATAPVLQASAPHHYARALRLHAQIALQQDQIEIALQRLHRALKWLETHSSLVQFSLPAIPAHAYEAGNIAQLHDTLLDTHKELPTALASEYGNVCLALAITLEEDKQLTANALYHITKAQRILYRLSALTWSPKPEPNHVLIATRALSALLNTVQLQTDIPFSVLSNTPATSFVDSLRVFLSASVHLTEQSIAQVREQVMSAYDKEIVALAQIEYARILCGMMMIQADSLYVNHAPSLARGVLEQALAKARADALRSIEAEAIIRLLAAYLNERMFDNLFALANEFLTQESLAEYRATYPAMVVDAHTLLARSYAAQGKPEIALLEAQTAFDMSLRAGLLQSIVASARVISLLKELLRDFAGALEFRKIADRYNDSLFVRTKAYTTLDEGLQLSSYQQRDETIALRATYAEQELQLRRQRWIIWSAIIAGIVLVSGQYTTSAKQSPPARDASRAHGVFWYCGA
jgi:hypothetical protein